MEAVTRRNFGLNTSEYRREHYHFSERQSPAMKDAEWDREPRTGAWIVVCMILGAGMWIAGAHFWGMW